MTIAPKNLQMNTKSTFILTAALLSASAFAISMTSVPVQSAQAEPDRCVSAQSEEFGNERVCGLTKAEAKDVKEFCQDQKKQEDGGTFGVQKCSSSQTGFGQFENV